MIPLRLLVVGSSLGWVAFGRLPKVELCGFHWLTGLRCPLCGMTRALVALLHGEWDRAIALHALSPLALGFAIALMLGDAIRIVRPQFGLPSVIAQRMTCGALAALLIYGIARWPLH